ncbi:MAG: hypothetical protein ACRCWY_09370, partial [Cellulosilyticaceae bacterium]
KTYELLKSVREDLRELEKQQHAIDLEQAQYYTSLADTLCLLPLIYESHQELLGRVIRLDSDLKLLKTKLL